MTATVTETTVFYIRYLSYNSLSTLVGVSVALLLLALLIGKEIVRAQGQPFSPAQMQVFDIPIVPLLFVLAVVVVLRFILPGI